MELDTTPGQLHQPPLAAGRRPLARYQRTAWWLARGVAYGGGGAVAASMLFAGVLVGQARWARRVIPMVEAPPPLGDGLYGGRLPGEPITLVMLGDSSAAGYGVQHTRQTPGALLATGVSDRLRRPVRLRRVAVPGARSAQLEAQVDAALDHRPDLAVILVGGNDVTGRTPPDLAVGHLSDAVCRLRAAGTEVIVGTCPDLGTIQPIQRPLRWLARRASRRLAAAQTVAAVEAGGWTVSLGDLLGPAFAADPARMFSADRFHPSAAGYATAAAALLPTLLAALGHDDGGVVAEPAGADLPTPGQAAPPRDQAAGAPPGARPEPALVPAPTAATEVRSLPEAAVEAAHTAGTEVSGARVAGRERGPGGRWALLRFRWRRPGGRPAEQRDRGPGGPDAILAGSGAGHTGAEAARGHGVDRPGSAPSR